jgi:hypothetical protein
MQPCLPGVREFRQFRWLERESHSKGIKHAPIALGSPGIARSALSFCRWSEAFHVSRGTDGPNIATAGFLRFIGVMEILGGLGLVLPGMLHIRTALIPLAATGLSIIMIGAVVVTIQTMGLALAALPFVTGVLALFVAYGRWRLAPLASPAGRVSAKSNRSTA